MYQPDRELVSYIVLGGCFWGVIKWELKMIHKKEREL